MATLHLGTFDVPALTELLPNLKRCLGVPGSPSEWRFTDGDSWEEWGEGFRPGEPEHVVLDGDSDALVADVAWVLSQSPGLLQPMTYPHQAGCIAAITVYDEADGDSRELYSITDSAAAHFIHHLVHRDGVDEAGVWQNEKWRERQDAPALTE